MRRALAICCLPYTQICPFTSGLYRASSLLLRLPLRFTIGLAFAATEFLQISRVWV